MYQDIPIPNLSLYYPENNITIKEVAERVIINDINESWIFVKKGLLRAIEQHEDTTTTIDFFSESSLINTPYYLPVFGNDLTVKMESIEPSVLYIIPGSYLQEICIKNNELNKYVHECSLQTYLKLYEQLLKLKDATLEHRYKFFLERYSKIYNRVSDRMIASFLGVHHTSLSRVKTKSILKNGDKQI